MSKLAKLIILYRNYILVCWLICTLIFMYYAQKLTIDYGVPNLLTKEHPSYIQYEKFKSVFGEEDVAYILGIDQNPLNQYNLYKNWEKLAEDFQTIEGVDTVICISKNIFYFEKDTAKKTLKTQGLPKQPIHNEADLQNYKQQINRLPFYNHWLNINDSVGVMMVSLNRKIFDSPDRKKIIEPFFKSVQNFEKSTQLKVHISGIPFVRATMREFVQKDFIVFILLSFLFCFGVIFLIFKNGSPTIISLLVIVSGIIWSVGSLELFNVTVNVLTGVIPTLVIVIGVPNCIYLLNYFIKQYKDSENIDQTLISTIKNMGNPIVLTNLTTAIGFFIFMFTGSEGLKEFGLVAGVNILFLFLLTIAFIPACLYYFPPDVKKQKVQRRSKISWYFINIIKRKSGLVFLCTAIFLMVSIFGIFRLKTTGNITDELPKGHQLFSDLRWFESVYQGIVPLNIYIESDKKNILNNERFIRNLDSLSQDIASTPLASKGMSLADVTKFIKQGFYNNDPDKFDIISKNERLFIMEYLNFNKNSSSQQLRSLIDSSQKIVRISYLIKDLNAEEMDAFELELYDKIYHYFPKEKYQTFITGSSYVFLKGTKYLLNNLFSSILWAVLIISIMMALLFKSFRITIIAVITNLIPLVLTLGFMGLFGIAIKPSTILIFSIAFGISVDDTIHFLSKFKQIIKKDFSNNYQAVIETLKTTAESMLFTSIALFFGFIVFVSSEFQGTKAMGILLSFCLIVAMLCNLLFLPSLLLIFNKRKKL